MGSHSYCHDVCLHVFFFFFFFFFFGGGGVLSFFSVFSFVNEGLINTFYCTNFLKMLNSKELLAEEDIRLI